jgi:hypothetical protein
MGLGVSEKVLQIHRVAPSRKLEGIIWLIYENVNSISNKLSNNQNVKKAKEIHDKLKVDIVAYNEHRLNMQDQQNVMGLISYSRVVRRIFNLWWRIMFTKTMDACKWEAPA